MIDQIAQGRRDDDALSSLAGRLAALNKKLDDEDKERITHLSGGKTLRDFANSLLDAIDPDKQENLAKAKYGRQPSEEEINVIAKELTETASRPFDDPKLRQLLKDIKQKSDIIIDDITTDHVIDASYDLKQAEERIKSFKEFIKKNKD